MPSARVSPPSRRARGLVRAFAAACVAAHAGVLHLPSACFAAAYSPRFGPRAASSSSHRGRAERVARAQAPQGGDEVLIGQTSAGTTRLPAELMSRHLSKATNFQQRYLEGFLVFAGQSALVGEDTNTATEESRLILAVRVQEFMAQGTDGRELWEAYCEKVVGNILGDFCGFDVKILISDVPTIRALRRIARRNLLGDIFPDRLLP